MSVASTAGKAWTQSCLELASRWRARGRILTEARTHLPPDAPGAIDHAGVGRMATKYADFLTLSAVDTGPIAARKAFRRHGRSLADMPWVNGVLHRALPLEVLTKLWSHFKAQGDDAATAEAAKLIKRRLG